MSAPRRSSELLTAAVKISMQARDIDDALARLASHFSAEYDLWRSTAFVFLPSKHARVVAVWSAGDVQVDVGTDIALSLTGQTQGAADSLLAGRALALDTATIDFGILSHIHRIDGIRSLLLLPLKGSERVGALSLASTSPQAFEPPDVAFFTGLAAAISLRFMQLIEESGQI